MPLHPQIEAVIEKMKAAGIAPVQSLAPTAAREQFEQMVAGRDVEPTPVGAIESRSAEGPAGPIPIRMYRPPDASSDALPALIYYHGGGHVIGSLDTHDGVARSLCANAGCVVVSVDYRMGPEHRFPAAVEDSLAALDWVAGNAAELGIDPRRLAVGGDSAGANLATVVSLLARNAGGPEIRFQLLVYPVADYSCGGTRSYEEFATGYGVLEAETMRWFRDHYLGDAAHAQDWRASPLKASSLAGLPPALLITAEYDVLHDEGVAYAARLAEAGVTVEHIDYPGMIDGFFGLVPMVDGANEAHERSAAALRRALA